MIFPQLDHKATKEAILSMFDLKNAELKAEINAANIVIDAENKVLYANYDKSGEKFVPKKRRSYNAEKLKSSHQHLIMKLKDMYSSYLKESRTHKTYSKVFWIAQTGIASEFGLNRCTVYRQLQRLEKFELVKHTFHGTDKGIRIRFNQRIMITEASLTKDLKGLENGKKEALTRPELAAFFPHTVAICIHNVSCNSLINSNMENAELLISYDSETANGIEPEINNDLNFIGKKHKGIKHTISEAEPLETEGSTQHETNFAPGRAEAERQKQIDFYIGIALNTILSTLYPKDRWFSPKKTDLAKQHLKKYFGSYPDANLSKLMEQLTYRVILTKYYVQASPERFVPDVDKWLDPYFEHGFAATRSWYLQSREAEKSKKEYNSNKKLLAKCLKFYYQDPTLENYTMGCKTLSRKHDKQLLDIYNRCVTDKSVFTHQTFNYQHN